MKGLVERIVPGVPPAVEAVRAHRASLISELKAIRDPQARFQWAVERARTRAALADELRVEAHRVPGCQVRLWWVTAVVEGRRWFASDSDAVTLKALTGLLAEAYHGETVEGLIADPPVFLEPLGLLRQLAESRRATVLRVVAAMVTGSMERGGLDRGGDVPVAMPKPSSDR
jgi:cysteine desulfuration protein SufE